MLVTLDFLAQKLSTTVRHLRELARNRNGSYAHRTIPKKKRGGRRPIAVPVRDLRPLLDRLDHLFRSMELLPLHAAAHGFREGHSVATHAKVHAGAAVLVSVDLQDWFTTVTTTDLDLALRTAHVGSLHGIEPGPQWTGDAARVVAKICTDVGGECGGHLPQGAPTSPLLANFAARYLDRWLAKTAQEFGFRYTRYADDLTFSSPTPAGYACVKRLLELVGKWVHDEGFTVNWHKVRVVRTWRRMEVAGLVVNPVRVSADGVSADNGATPVRCSRVYVRQIRAAINNYHKGRAKWTREQIVSAVAFVTMVNKEQGEKLGRGLSCE